MPTELINEPKKCRMDTVLYVVTTPRSGFSQPNYGKIYLRIELTQNLIGDARSTSNTNSKTATQNRPAQSSGK